MTKQDSLLDKYYKGETSLDEERQLKALAINEEEQSSEQDILGYFENESIIPEGLEEEIYSTVLEVQKKKKGIRMKLYSAISAAAVLLIVLGVYLNERSSQQMQMEDNFFVMEQALFQVSESLQPPQEQEEMLVLWIDNDVEIIIN